MEPTITEAPAHALFEEQARRTPGATAVRCGADSLSYGALVRRANQVASRLHALGVRAEDRVGICLDRSIELMIAVLGVLKAGGAYVPLDPAYPARRLSFMLDDAGASAVLTRQRWRELVAGRGAVLCFDGDDGLDGERVEPPRVAVRASDLAYVLYTSGSTGVPKGVMIEHGSVTALAAALVPLFDVRAESRVLQFASPCFDVSVSEMWMAWRAGAELHLAPRDELIPGPTLVRLLRERAITHASLPPSALAALPDADLPALAAIISAGEACPPDLAARWGEGRRFFNAYGPTEATVYATVHAWQRGDRRVPIGRPLEGRHVVVLDAEGRPLPAGEAGELCLGGRGVARGYWRRPDLTAERFIPEAGGGRLYRTGDLARALPDGTIEYLGRLDHQVKVRGFRVELGEIEAVLRRQGSVRDAVVVGREDGGGPKRLVAYVVRAPGGEGSAAAWRRAVAAELPEHMIPSVFVELPALPLSPSGKVDRAALPAPGSERPALAPAYVAPRTATERSLAAIWTAVIGVSPVGLDDDLLGLGGDSLHAARILARVAGAFGVEIPFRDLFEARTLARFAERVDAGGEAAPPLVPSREPPLSYAQERLWFLHQLAPASAAYAVPALLHLRGALDVPALARALGALTARHEPLRTRIVVAGDRPAPIVDPPSVPALAVTDLRASPGQLLALCREEAARPFDLAGGPLLRARLFRVAEDEHVLCLVMHHIASDGWSLRVLVEDLAALYAGAGPSLPPLPIRYGDHAAWQRERLALGALDRELVYWKAELEGAPARLELPADRPRPAVLRFRGARCPFRFSGALTAALDALCRAEGVTRFMALLAAVNALLHRYTGAEDIVVGTPVAGRSRLEIEGLVGFFANTLAIRTRMDGDPTGRALLARVRERALGAFAHQELPFERLVEALRVERDPAHHPVFQVMFALQEPLPEVERGGVAFRLEDLDTGAAPFNLSCQVWGSEGGLTGEIVYDTDLFDAPTASAMAAHLEALLLRLTAGPDRRLSELLVLSEADAQLRAALPAVEARLLAVPGVEDASVLLRSASLREQGIVAYAVTTSRVPDVVPVPVVPRTPEGLVDARALRRLPVVDTAALQRWEAELRALPGVREVAVAIQELAAPAPRLHLADLLPAVLFSPLSGSASPPTLPERSPGAPSVSTTPAYANGGPLDVADGEPATLAAALLRTASTYPDRGVTVVTAQGGESFLSYDALLREARRVLAGLRERGLHAGDRALLQVASLTDHIVAFWGCVLGGITPVAVAIAPTYEVPGGVTAKLHSAWELLGRPAIVASARLAPPMHGLAALYPMPGMVVLPVEELREHPPAERHHEARPEDVAFLQLTSGSTGVPKCIQVTHRGILRHVHGVTRFNGYQAGDVWLNWLPFDHVGAVLTVHLKDVVLGCSEVQMETERVLADPLAWLDRMEAHRVTHSWSPNFGYKLVSDAIAAAPGRSWDLSSVERLMNGGEQVTAPVARAFLRAVAPFGVRSLAMQPAFGMAEACTCIAYDNAFHPETSGSDEAGGAPFVELGPPIPGVEIRIADAGNRVVPEGVIGRMQIRGGVVTPGYLHDEGANREAFVGDGWFNSGDLGFLAGGRLTLTGREKETIIVRGANFYAYEIEDVVNAVPGVEPTFSAACAVDNPRHGTEGLAVFFVPRGEAATVEARAALREAVRAEVTVRLGVVPAVVLPIPREDFPKTTSGKIQRSALGRALREGRFAALSRELDLAAGGPATLPDWFHAPVWQEREALPLLPLPAGGAALVVGDRSGLGDRVAAALSREGRLRVRLIRRGEEAAVGGPVDHVIHLAGYDDGDGDALDLLALVQALLRAGGPGLPAGSVRLTVVSRRAQPVLPGEAIAGEKAPVLGLVRTIPHEIPWLDARHVDLEGDALDADAHAVLEELRNVRRDREIARRGGRRWALGLTRVDLASAPPRPLPFTPGGAYLVTGGLGGIGVRVVGLLLARYGARLLLVGRSPLDGERLSALRALTAGGEGEAVYEPVDVADAGALEATVAGVEARWGRALDGVIHLAGVFAPRPLADETPETLAAALRPAVEGGRSVRAILEARPGAGLVAVSSVTAFFGGFAVGAYAAASRFTEHLAYALGPRAHCLSFSEWDDVGMTRANPMRDLSRARGFQAVSPERGLSSLLAGLHRGPPRLLVGLDGQSPHVLRHLHGASVAPSRVVAFVAADRAPEAVLHDRFGVRTVVEIRRVERLPRAPDGAVDLAALSDAPAAEARGGGAPVAPRDEVEAAVARIWQELLGLDRVGVHDSFFALGGHSMMLARARVRLEAAFAREIAVVDLFRHPTVATLAAYLRDEARAPSGVRERAARQRAALAAPPPAARVRRKIHG